MRTDSYISPESGGESCDVTCSICIANYNGSDVIDDCIGSVLAQEADFPIEIIMHDDASSDNSVAHVRQKYPGVRVIASPENVGFCTANNRMVKEARGTYVLLLNNDAILFPDALTTLMEGAMCLESRAILGLPQYNAGTGTLIDRGSLLDPFLNAVPNLNGDLRNVGAVIGACLWIDKSLWVELDGFPERFHTLAEDTFLCCRARLAGYPVQVMRESGFHHWVGRSLSGGKLQNGRLVTSISRRIRTERNKSFTMVVCYPLGLLLAIFPLHVLLLIFEGLAVACTHNGSYVFQRVYWDCFMALWQERRELWQWRMDVQSSRRAGLVDFLGGFCWAPYKLKMFIRYGWPKLS